MMKGRSTVFPKKFAIPIQDFLDVLALTMRVYLSAESKLAREVVTTIT